MLQNSCAKNKGVDIKSGEAKKIFSKTTTIALSINMNKWGGNNEYYQFL